MSDSDDSYGPALPPGLQKSGSDEYGPALPPSGPELPPSNNPVIGPVIPPGVKKTSKSSSDSDSDSSSSDCNSRKKHKKKKRRKRSSSSSDDDNKRSSKKKRRHSSSSDTDSSDSSQDLKHSKSKTVAGQNMIGPVLPGSMQDSGSGRDSSIGPALPPGFQGSNQQQDDESDDDDFGIGPHIALKVNKGDISAAQEFEDRSAKMKQKLTEKTDVAEVPTQRESWMTELPSDMGARFGLGNRQFRKGEAAEIDSSWTETPQDKVNKKEGKKKKRDKDTYFQSEADKQAAKQIEEYNKKHRKESLLEMHKKAQKKKKKKEKKKNKGKDKPKERQPFDRERDLKVNQLDDAQRKAIIKRSQELGSRFKSGGSGTSFL